MSVYSILNMGLVYPLLWHLWDPSTKSPEDAEGQL